MTRRVSKPPAAARKRGTRKAVQATTSKVRQLVHELQVHSEEIMAQNDQLVKAQLDIEHARDRFADLYDFAPIGYVSLDVHGVIVEVNLTATTLLGKPREFLLNMPFSALIVPTDRNQYRAFLNSSMQANDHRAPVIDLAIRTGRIVRVIARRQSTVGGDDSIFAALIDITEQRQLEEQRTMSLEFERARAAELADEVGVRTAAETRVKALLERLVSVQEEERRRIAQNLHDHLGQQLTALRLTVEALRDVRLSRASMDEKIELLDRLATAIDRDVDRLAWDLRPAPVDTVGLAAALEALTREWSSVHGIDAEFHVANAESLRLSPDIESNIYRIAQESLTNIAKHAAASHVSLMLDIQHTEVTLIVEDDGRGFNAEAVINTRGRHNGMGVLGILERAAVIRGNAQFESSISEGTTLFVRAPTRLANSRTDS